MRIRPLTEFQKKSLLLASGLLEKKSLDVRRKEVLSDPEFIAAREAKLRTNSYFLASKEEKERMLEEQLRVGVTFHQVLELAGNGFKARVIKEALNLPEWPTTIRDWIKGKYKPHEINVKFLTAQLEESSFQPHFDVEMADLTGHYLGALSHVPIDRLKFVAPERYRLDAAAISLGRKLGKKINITRYGTRQGFTVLARELGNYLKSITVGKSRIPHELLGESKEKSLALVRAYFHHQGSIFKPTSEMRPRFVIQLNKNVELVYHLLPLLARLDIFPEVSVAGKRVRMFVRDRNELLQMLKLKLLPQPLHDRLEELMSETPTVLNVYTLKQYEAAFELLSKDRPVREIAKKIGVPRLIVYNWFRGIKPPQVDRYILGRNHALERGLPFQVFPFTLGVADFQKTGKRKVVNGYAKRPVQPGSPGERPKSMFDQDKESAGWKEPITQMDLDHVIDVRLAIEKAQERMTPKQRQAFEDFTLGKPANNLHLKNALKVLRQDSRLRKLYDDTPE